MSSRSLLRAVVVPAAGGDDDAPLTDRGWRVTVLVLHVVFLAPLAAAVAAVLVGDVDGSPAVLLVALGALAVAYAVAGAPGLRNRDRGRTAVYLAVLVAVVAVLAWEQASLLFLMFVAFPQVWFMVGTVRAGLLWTLALGAASTAGPFVHVAQGSEPLSGPGRTLVGLALSVALGLWIATVLDQSRQRAALIRELEATRAELAAAHHERGVAAERERLAREVHDTLAQGYTSIVVLAQTAALQLGDPAAAAERLALIEDVARENLAEARAMVAAFTPVPLEGATLVEALHRLAERFARETGLDTRVDARALGTEALGGGPLLSRNDEVVLLRGAQEALSNVRRHAAASAVVLRLSVVGEADARQVSVHVEDDGVGFDPAAAGGHGLAGLRSRAAEVGGAVDVVSAPGAGTRVTVRATTARTTAQRTSQRGTSEERNEAGVEQ